MNCDQVRTELIAYVKRELGAEHARRVEAHLARCHACRKELESANRVLAWTEAADSEAVARKIDQTIEDAIRASASDVHWEAQRDGTLLVRQRVDGVLHEVDRIDTVLREGVVARIKMMADMSVEETRTPQDGRIPHVTVDDKDYDIRVNCAPFVLGEGVVMRILDRSKVMLGLDRLGFSPDQLETLRKLAHQPNGLLLVTGPTGSGKTTTVYSILHELASPAIKIMSVEDPVEYILPGVNQLQVHKKAGLTFPTAMRSFLRADPDVIYSGEIRDIDTGMLCMEAALTGHLVLSALHTNDAPSALIRLVDMGAEPYLLGATVIGIVSQRLARRVCQHCKEEVEADLNSPVMKYLGVAAEDLQEHKVYQGKGCDVCRQTGYQGRTGLYEILTMSSEVSSLINTRASLAEIRDAAIGNGMTTLREDGKRKVLDGITTADEVLRVTTNV